MIAKSRVGWIVAGWAPGVWTSDSRVRFHCTTTFPCAELGVADSAECVEPASAVTLSAAIAVNAAAMPRRGVKTWVCLVRMTVLRSRRCPVLVDDQGGLVAARCRVARRCVPLLLRR